MKLSANSICYIWKLDSFCGTEGVTELLSEHISYNEIKAFYSFQSHIKRTYLNIQAHFWDKIDLFLLLSSTSGTLIFYKNNLRTTFIIAGKKNKNNLVVSIKNIRTNYHHTFQLKNNFFRKIHVSSAVLTKLIVLVLTFFSKDSFGVD